MTQFASDQLEAMTSAASSLVSIQSRIDLQEGFVASLIDVIHNGIVLLVAADMIESSTRLHALLTPPQLCLHSLSISFSHSLLTFLVFASFFSFLFFFFFSF